MMDVFLLSTGLVAMAEMGDKTQLLALLLAARYRQPLPILAAILLATLFNHALAAALGAWLSGLPHISSSGCRLCARHSETSAMDRFLTRIF